MLLLNFSFKALLLILVVLYKKGIVVLFNFVDIKFFRIYYFNKGSKNVSKDVNIYYKLKFFSQVKFPDNGINIAR